MASLIWGLVRGVFRIGLYGLILPLLYVIEPFRKLRFTHMWTARFGTLAFVNHQFLALRALDGADAKTTRIWFGANPANRQLFEMWKRVMPVVESRLLSALYHHTQDIISKFPFFKPWPYDLEGYRETDFGPVLEFNDEDERKGRDVLGTMGIGPDDWFVCFQSRDALFHELRGGGDSGSHRNCSIENYLPSAGHITGQGGWAIRMGSAVDRPLPETGDPRIIDYASHFRTDFADVYLLGKCRFFLCCGSGTESIPPLFKRPIAQANRVPLWPTVAGRQSLYCPKLVRETATGRLLTWQELEELDAFTLGGHVKRWLYPGGLAPLGLELVENSAAEILDLCMDMEDTLEGRLSEADKKLQADYKLRYLKGFRNSEHAPEIGPRFLAKYQDLIGL